MKSYTYIISFFLWSLLLPSHVLCICNIYCDDRNSTLATPPLRQPVTTEIHSRILTLIISDTDNMVFARIENGDPRDEVWLDRSFDGGISWIDGSKLGETFIPDDGSRQINTTMYNVDNPTILKYGALRVCGKANNRPEIACTSWARSTIEASTPISAAATAMMQFYDDNGLWKTTGWWNSANCLTALIDYSLATGSQTYRYAINKTYELQKDSHYGNFTNEYIDDTLWWGLAWIRAYDLTGNSKYLEMAKITSDYSYSYKDEICNGGLWWTVDKTYKNAITNELFIKLAASLHNRIPGDMKYLQQAIEIWNWFRNSTMINVDNLINDGLTTEGCRNNGQTTWTYNQGVILGGLLELYKATANWNFIEEAVKIADAVLASNYLNDANGVLREPCEANSDCGGDGPSFKGIFMRNLGELDKELNGRYLTYIVRQGDAVYMNTRNSLDQYGLRWGGPFDFTTAATQHSAFEAIIAGFRPQK